MPESVVGLNSCRSELSQKDKGSCAVSHMRFNSLIKHCLSTTNSEQV